MKYKTNKRRLWILLMAFAFILSVSIILAEHIYLQLAIKRFISEALINNQIYQSKEIAHNFINQFDYLFYIEYFIIMTQVFFLSVFFAFIIIKFFSRKLLNLDRLDSLNSTLNQATKIAQIGFWEYDAKTTKIFWSEGIYKLLEVDDKSIEMTLDSFLYYVHKDDRAAVLEEFETSIDKKRDYFISHKVITEKGNIKYVEERGKHLFDGSGNLIKSIGSIYDITERYYSEKKFRNLLEYASDGIHILDQKGNVVMCSQSFADNLGYTYEEAKKLNVSDWDASIPKDQLVPTIAHLIKKPAAFETTHQRKDGSIINVQINAKGIDLDGKKYLYASQRDTTEFHRLNKKLEALSLTDELTQLQNRKAYNAKIYELLVNYKRYQTIFCIIMFDVDYFKKINDEYGHDTGDSVLKKIAKNTQSNLRESDYVFRIGGEEFIILLSNTVLENAIAVAEKLRAAIYNKVIIAEKHVAISLGVTEVQQADSVDTIFQRVDGLLYKSKKNGRNQTSWQ
ncbi:diguanylate cyclase [Thiotrichales bacterium 19S11-10]|nr:diguanylate cyclase [Thiotrichales bacterium 19S11-10]